MDKKYKLIKTLKELDLSKGARSSLSSASGKSDFSTLSQEEKFNKAYAKDFSITPPKKILPPKPPKTDSLRPRTAPSQKLKIIEKTEIIKQAKNPINKNYISIEKYNKLREEGKFGDDAPKSPKIYDTIKNPLNGNFITVNHYNKLKDEGMFGNIVEKPKTILPPKPKSPEVYPPTKDQLIEMMEETKNIKEPGKRKYRQEDIISSLIKNDAIDLNYNDIMSGFFEKVVLPMMKYDDEIEKMIKDIKKDKNNLIKFYDLIYQKKREYPGHGFVLKVPDHFHAIMEKRRIAEYQETEKKKELYYKALGPLPNPFAKLNKGFKNPNKPSAIQKKN